MLPKKNRTDKKTVEAIFKNGKFLHSSHFTFKFIPSPEGSGNKISFIVPKSAARLATKRNSLRRLGYAAMKGLMNGLPPGISGVFIFKRPEEDISVIQNEIKDIFDKVR